jgi:uncharacterized membrane protein YfcA
MLADPWFYVTAVPAVVILGLSKGGFSALGLLMVPLMALTISPVQAAAITLPILVMSDIVALISYRRVYDVATLRNMVPGALAGVAIGWATASWVTETHIRLIVGAVSLVFAAQFFLFRGSEAPPSPQNPPKGIFWGLAAGFISFVSHAGGPPFQVYAAPLRLEPRIFAGTAVIFFALINAIKLPPYFFLGQFDRTNLLTAAVLVPVSVPSVMLGVWLVRRFDPRRFYTLIYATIIVVGLFLVAESVVELARP